MEDNLRSYRTRVLKKSDTFPDDFIKNVRIMQMKLLIYQFRSNNIKRMAMKQGLYAQVVKIIRKASKFIAENKNKKESKFKVQG